LSRIYVDAANSRQGREWYAALALIVRSVAATISLWRNRMRDRRALAQMSERGLADIGVCRSQIAGELDKPFWRA
jgi:uncharacterized protein YjiS (DUF1127 family)